jgi:hypothetical protein
MFDLIEYFRAIFNLFSQIAHIFLIVARGAGR